MRDAVVLHHGAESGTVLHVIESETELDAWNLEEPGLMIDTSFGGLVFYPTKSLIDDEIALKSRASR
ncbi:MAG: hypothetical protein JWR19_318 [Pedosphaera sp.]|nr:hypothetical protein [Pedosphaera sp.]